MFPNVSSNCLSKRIHYRTGCIYGCICLTFLHCVLLNVSSNHLPERMQSHTGYICLTFLHCAFSNVSSNCLHERMQSYTSCIRLNFLYCAFSNVSSNGLPEKKQSHIGCICSTFLLYALSNVPKTIIVTLGCFTKTCFFFRNKYLYVDKMRGKSIWNIWTQITAFSFVKTQSRKKWWT